jgi:uncharacterized membrane protein YbhN (UPF0104 family)
MTVIWDTIAAGIDRLSTARPQYVAAALALYIVSIWIVGARWRGFLAALGAKITLWRACLATLGGIAAGNLTPSSRLAGEACRIALARLDSAVTWKAATVATLWDRLSEAPPVIVLAVMAAVAVRKLASTSRSLMPAIGLTIVTVGGVLAVRAIRKSGLRLGGWRERLALDEISGSVFARGVAYSSLLWLQDYLRLICAMLAFNVTLAPTEVAALSILAMLGGLVPTLGGLGAVEGGLVAGLAAFGVDLPTAAAITATERAISYGFSTGAGLIVIALLGGRSLWSSRRTLGIVPPRVSESQTDAGSIRYP